MCVRVWSEDNFQESVLFVSYVPEVELRCEVQPAQQELLLSEPFHWFSKATFSSYCISYLSYPTP